MGNNEPKPKDGLIHNQSKQELICILHYSKLQAVEAETVQKASANIGVQANLATVNFNAAIKGQIGLVEKKLLEKVKCNYVLQPERMALIKEPNFKEVKFLTIMSKSGKILLESMRVQDIRHLRIRIDPHLGYQQIDEKDIQKMKKIYNGTTLKNGQCPCGAKTSLKENTPSICTQCKNEETDTWSCGKYPLLHAYCGSCYEKVFKEQAVREATKKGK